MDSFHVPEMDAKGVAVLRRVPGKRDSPRGRGGSIRQFCERQGSIDLSRRIRLAFDEIKTHLAGEKPLHGYELIWKVGRVGEVLLRLSKGGWFDAWERGDEMSRLLRDSRVSTEILAADAAAVELRSSLPRRAVFLEGVERSRLFFSDDEELRMARFLVMLKIGNRKIRIGDIKKCFADPQRTALEATLGISAAYVSGYWGGEKGRLASEDGALAHMIVEMKDEFYSSRLRGPNQIGLEQLQDDARVYVDEAVRDLESDERLSLGQTIFAVYQKWIGPWIGPQRSVYGREMVRDQLIRLREEKLGKGPEMEFTLQVDVAPPPKPAPLSEKEAACIEGIHVVFNLALDGKSDSEKFKSFQRVAAKILPQKGDRWGAPRLSQKEELCREGVCQIFNLAFDGQSDSEKFKAFQRVVSKIDHIKGMVLEVEGDRLSL